MLGGRCNWVVWGRNDMNYIELQTANEAGHCGLPKNRRKSVEAWGLMIYIPQVMTIITLMTVIYTIVHSETQGVRVRNTKLWTSLRGQPVKHLLAPSPATSDSSETFSRASPPKNHGPDRPPFHIPPLAARRSPWKINPTPFGDPVVPSQKAFWGGCHVRSRCLRFGTTGSQTGLVTTVRYTRDRSRPYAVPLRSSPERSAALSPERHRDSERNGRTATGPRQVK